MLKDAQTSAAHRSWHGVTRVTFGRQLLAKDISNQCDSWRFLLQLGLQTPVGCLFDLLDELNNGRVAGKPLPSHTVGDYKLYASTGRWLLWVRIRSLQLRTSKCLQWMLSQCLRQIAFYICGNPGLCSPGQHLTSIALQ